MCEMCGNSEMSNRDIPEHSSLTSLNCRFLLYNSIKVLYVQYIIQKRQSLRLISRMNVFRSISRKYTLPPVSEP